ncbi:translintranslin-like [Octopus vulgaris]|uniref:Translin n=1 Tax=Octopus vulgaris TaxID=6645 RepID=A0AA36B092_OCTVU|nr:translintranslin-like [Octopus vulgaris]
MAQESDLTLMFASFQKYLDSEREIREKIREAVNDLEDTAREVLTLLQSIHQVENHQRVPEICEKAKGYFSKIKEQYANIASKVPDNQFYRFHDHWRFVTQRLSFLAAFLFYLQHHGLICYEDTAEMLGLKVDRKCGFHLDLEDFLMGLLQMATELTRLAVNSVTAGNYQEPLLIKKSVTQLDAGFRLLNLKNDSLRKRYDALKYDLKKIEEIVYDLSIRGLSNKTENQ